LAHVLKRFIWVEKYHFCGWIKVGKIKMDKRGRVLIPSEERERLHLKPGVEFELMDEKGVLLLKPIIPKPVRARSKKEAWDKETFLDAGEATFGG
jgi:AbrB family looped-hinge helix DNA binding protein